MLALQIASGVVPEQSGGGAGFGVFDAPAVRTVTPAKVQPAASIGVGLPYGAAQWQQPFDPNDHLAFGISFNDLLEVGETITGVDSIAVSSTGAGLGVAIDQALGFAPIIDADGKRRIQFWLSVSSAFQGSPAFDASGTPVAITVRITTSKSNRFERSAIVTVRQL